mgnify:CR=1 FL=1
MTREMLFLCDVLEDWCEKNNFPHRCASDLLYNADTKGRLTGNQAYWLESFISTWDIVNQNS